MGGEMLKRRDFIKISALMAAGAIIPLTVYDQTIAIVAFPASNTKYRLSYHLTGNKQQGCSAKHGSPVNSDNAYLPDRIQWE
jgi:hypothetical protein